MPYIDPEVRQVFEHAFDLDEIVAYARAPGELNYVLTMLMQAWIGRDANYTRLNTAIGILECVKQELYRRVVAPYEDKKCQQNGDVYK